MNNYDSAIAWLYGLEAAKGMDFKLERVELALASLGDPHRDFATIHVAGTNGKGSVAAMCHSMLEAAGYRTALYISPHLVRFTERIRVGAEEISPDEVVELVGEIHRAATSRGIDLTFFEFVTVMAFLHFARRRVDAAVVEVGLGGRLDATNVIVPEVAVVTTIGLDHQSYLGDTIEQIAAEKGGILKGGRPAVFGRLRPEARRVLDGIAAGGGCPVLRLGTEFDLSPGESPVYRDRAGELEGLVLPLRGAHQRDNAATAIAAVRAAATRLPIGEEAIRTGLARTKWPGRLETVAESPKVVLDGAHNPDGVEVLIHEIRQLALNRRVHLLFGVMSDKAWMPMVEALAGVVDDVTTTVLPPRGADAAQLADAFARWRPSRVIHDPVEAFERLVTEAEADDVVLVAGTLFLIGAVYPAAERLRARVAAEGIAGAS